MRLKEWTYYIADFETTVYEGQDKTEVWASAIVPLGHEYSDNDVVIGHSIDDFWYYVSKALPGNIVIYFHNLKFDGEFIISYFLRKKIYKQAISKWYDKDNNEHYTFLADKEMCNNQFKYCISDMGQWYYIMIKQNDRFIQIRDSYKMLPFSVQKIGDGFKTVHRKSSIEYTGYRYAGCNITDEEKKYIANDVQVVNEALSIMFEQGHSKMTIGSCCLDEFKKTHDKKEYNILFPNLYDIPINCDKHNAHTVGDWIKKSYRGGWCYIVPEKANRIFHNGLTADVNSLYPSVMSSDSGNIYPVGKPKFWTGNFIPDEAKLSDRFFFIRIRTQFKIKPNYLPFIQMKGNLLYRQTESLITSDVYNRATKCYERYYIDDNGEKKEAICEITMTMMDYYLFHEHYIVINEEIIDGCWFYALKPNQLFDAYINKYKELKMTSTGALRELAKLFLNNLYGKMASSTNSSFKVAMLKDDNSLGFKTETANDKEPGYIPVGTAITSYARNFTIRAAQKNYYGAHKRGFIYADTDSIHCDLGANELKGIKLHDTNFCCWKLESQWDEAIFVRQKTYIEHVISENFKPLKSGAYYLIKCAGMPKRCKELFMHSMLQDITDYNGYNYEEIDFISVKRELIDFKKGLVVPSKLRPMHIDGGIILVPTTYELR